MPTFLPPCQQGENDPPQPVCEPWSPEGLLAHALTYAEAGLAVLPVSPAIRNDGRPDKRPLTPHGVKDATREPAIIRAWWAGRFPGAMIGVALGSVSGGWIVVDIDNKDGGTNGFDTVHDLAMRGFVLSPTEGCVFTPSKGLHLWFKSSLPCPPSRSLPGVDLLSDGKYVIAPPSKLADGRRYEFLTYGARQ